MTYFNRLRRLNRYASRPLGADYRQLWRATAISNLGDGVFLVTFPLLAASVSHDPIAVSAVTLALTVPWLLFALVSGALVDRWDRLVVMREST